MFMRILMLMLSSCSKIPLVIPYAKHPLEISPAAKHPLEISPILPIRVLTLIIACTRTVQEHEISGDGVKRLPGC